QAKRRPASQLAFAALAPSRAFADASCVRFWLSVSARAKSTYALRSGYWPLPRIPDRNALSIACAAAVGLVSRTWRPDFHIKFGGTGANRLPEIARLPPISAASSYHSSARP